MNKKILLPLIASLILTSSASLWADSETLNHETGVLQIFVADENGAALANAPVYITDGVHTEYLESNSMGSVSAVLQEGKYTISSAITKPLADCLERSVSPDAHILVQAQDTASVVLTLHPIQDPIASLSDATLKKMGVAHEVAKYNN